MAADSSAELLGPLLRDVSRSFYLTLRVLPASLRPQISLAYLLARASDTIADTNRLPEAERIATLAAYREEVANPTGAPGVCESLAGKLTGAGQDGDASPAESQLLRRLPECLRLLAKFTAADRHQIASLLRTIVTGQIFDLERFPTGKLTALREDAETDRYTYLVAGCVGEFWTRMCAAHLPGLAGWQDGRMDEAGVRFGKGLQLVNILRDLPRDLRIGRCYLPVEDPVALLEPGSFSRFEPVYRKWLDVALAHLDAGWQYTLAIPANEKRLRLACAWPIWIGVKTLARLRRVNPLDPTQRVRVARVEVYGIMLESALLVGNDAALEEAYRRLRRG